MFYNSEFSLTRIIPPLCLSELVRIYRSIENKLWKFPPNVLSQIQLSAILIHNKA
jgi:hypothetical protein